MGNKNNNKLKKVKETRSKMKQERKKNKIRNKKKQNIKEIK